MSGLNSSARLLKVPQLDGLALPFVTKVFPLGCFIPRQRDCLSGRGRILRMCTHDSIVVNRTHDPTLASVVGSSMIVDLDTRRKHKPIDEALAIQHGIDVNPDMAICRPGPVSGNH